MQTVATVRSLRVASKEQLTKPHNQPGSGGHSHLAIYTAEGIRLVPMNEIIRATADSNYCRMHLRSGESILTSKTLKCICTLLPDEDFFRSHQSHLIRLKEISLVRRQELVLLDGSILPIARAQRTLLLDRLSLISYKI